MSAITLTDSDVERIARRTAALVGATGPSATQTTLTSDELMAKLKCESLSATYRLATVLKIRPFARGKYRTADVEAAIARASFNANRKNLPNE